MKWRRCPADHFMMLEAMVTRLVLPGMGKENPEISVNPVNKLTAAVP